MDLAHEHAVAAETDLIAKYDAALASAAVSSDQALSERLVAIRAEHKAHLAAVQEGYPGAGAAPSANVGAAVGSPDLKALISDLVKAEQDAASRFASDAGDLDGVSARLLASISASESGHVALLLAGSS